MLQNAVAVGVPDAADAASSRVWQKPGKKNTGGGRRVGGVRAVAVAEAAAAASATASAGVDQRAKAARVE